ncbi:MAG: TonB-dependent receptor, partial [Rhodothermales bacterium]
FTATGSQYFSTPTIDLSGTPIRRDNTIGDVSVKGDFEYVSGERTSIKAGFWSGAFLFRLKNEFDGEVALDARSNSLYTSAYVQGTHRPVPSVSIQGGLRANYFEQGGFVRLAPRLSAEYEPSSSVRFQLAYGRYNQFLTLITSELFSGFDTWLSTGKDVPPAYGDQVVAGVKTSLDAGVNVDVEAYYRTMRDLFELDPFVSDPAGLDYVELFRFGEGDAYGLETIVQRSEGRLNGFVAYTLGKTRRRFPNVNNFAYYTPKYDRTHDLKTVLNYDLSPAWRASAVWTYATGQAYTEPLGQYRLVDQPFGADSWNVLVTEYNNERLPAYHRLDLGVSRRGTWFGSVGFELQLQVINAYGRRNTWFNFFEFTDDFEVERTTVPQIPVPLPNISLTLDF